MIQRCWGTELQRRCTCLKELLELCCFFSCCHCNITPFLVEFITLISLSSHPVVSPHLQLLFWLPLQFQTTARILSITNSILFSSEAALVSLLPYFSIDLHKL